MRGDRRDPCSWNGHAGANVDAFGLRGGERQGGVAVRPNHLRVRYPGVVEAQLFCVADEIPFVYVCINGHAELHKLSS
jgi:hypothetical protein